MDDIASPLTLVSGLGPLKTQWLLLAHTLLSLGDALLTTALCDPSLESTLQAHGPGSLVLQALLLMVIYYVTH